MRPITVSIHTQPPTRLTAYTKFDMAPHRIAIKRVLLNSVLASFLLWTANVAHGQNIRQNINRQMVNHLLAQLETSKADSNRVNTLLELGKFHIYKFGEATIDLDSARTYLNQARQLSIKLGLHRKRHAAEAMLVVAHMEQRDTTVGRMHFRKLIADCRRTSDKEGEADAIGRFASCLVFVTKNLPQVFACYQQAASIFRAIGNYESEILMLREIATIHAKNGQLDLAENEFVTVLNRYKAIHYPRLHYTYYWLSYINRLKGNYDKALMYSFQCVESMNRTGDTLSAPVFYGNVAQVYWELGEQQPAISWYKKALQKWRQAKQADFAMYHAASFIVQNMTAHHQAPEAIRLLKNLVAEIPPTNKVQKASIAQSLAVCYEALQQSSLAEHYYLEAIDWYEKSHQHTEMSQKLPVEVGRFYLKQNDFKKAKFFLEKSLAYVPQENSLSTVKDIHLMLFKIDSAQTDFVSAINHFRLHKTLNDSLFNETKAKQTAQLEVQYEVKEHQQNIDLLTKQSKLQENELRQTRITRNTTLICSIMLLLLLGLSYNQYRLKLRSSQLLEAKQGEINQKNQTLETLLDEQQQLLTEKEWMLKEIHHRVKNNLQIITSLLHSQGVYLKDQAAQSAIRESQNRVHAMALIHQKLYQSDRLAAIPMAEYVAEIIDYLIKSFDREDTIRKRIDVTSIELDVTLAVPLGLILNEAVTNSLKYAFRATQQGTIQVELTVLDSHTYLLVVSDDGIGLPAEFNPHKSRTLGMSLMLGLSKQIGGNLLISQSEGVQVRLVFSEETIIRENLTKA